MQVYRFRILRDNKVVLEQVVEAISEDFIREWCFDVYGGMVKAEVEETSDPAVAGFNDEGDILFFADTE